MSMNTVPERLAALRAAMKANGVDVYLIPVGDPHSSEYLPDHYTSLTYFSGFHGENSNFVVTPTESAVWADGRYFVQAEKEIAGTEIQLMRMGEPGVPTVEEYCGKVLPENGVLGLCGLTASCGLVRGVQKELDAKKGTIKTLNLEDELWTEGRPALPATPAWILPKEYAGFSPAEKLERLRGRLKELGCTAQLVGKLDNLAWLLNLRAMDIQCTPYAMSYCYVTPERAVLFINTARLGAEAAAELKANGVEIQEYDDVLKFLAAETEPQTVLADPASVNFAVYETLQNNAALTVKDEADPLLPMKGVKNEVELAHDREAHLRDAVAVFVPIFPLLQGNHEKFAVLVGAEVAHVLHIRLADAAIRQAKRVKVCHSALVVPCVHQHQHSIARCRHRVRKKGIAVIFLLLDEDFRVLHRCNISVHGLAVFAADGEDAAGQVVDAVHLFAVRDEHGEAMRRVRQFRARESVLFQVFQPFLQVFQLRIVSRPVHIRRNERHFLLTGLPSVERIQARGLLLHENRHAAVQRQQSLRGIAFLAFFLRQRFIRDTFVFAH